MWNPHFGLWARNCGAMGVRVTKLEELDEALTQAMAHPGPSLVEVMTAATLV
ncbi:MAG: thiamine pyrophosphate-dependent enzyme [Acidobacteriota bacterium]|nr:thiamine pyrophosphate-dependent enzyme [Acidobacteriota bacterium]